MAKKVSISKRASVKLDKLLNRLQKEWSIEVKKEFIGKLDRALDIISVNPDAFPISNLQKGIHKCVVTKQTTIYYRVKAVEIQIITVFETRQSPKKLKKELKKF
jgi:plasmid stabilization system protein ParE